MKFLLELNLKQLNQDILRELPEDIIELIKTNEYIPLIVDSLRRK
jgi:hypothetical protein